MKNYIPDSVLEFLETSEGKRKFSELSGKNQTRQTVYDRRQSFLHPPQNVLRWLTMRDELIKSARGYKKRKKKA